MDGAAVWFTRPWLILARSDIYGNGYGRVGFVMFYIEENRSTALFHSSAWNRPRTQMVHKIGSWAINALLALYNPGSLAMNRVTNARITPRFV